MTRQVFFTSDTHFGHKAINEYMDRGCLNIEDHDRTLIDRWNEVVPRNGLVYHLGDFCWGATRTKVKHILSQLNGTVILIRGNHDKGIKLNWTGPDLFNAIYDLKTIKLQGYNIVLCHYKMATWDKKHYGALHFHGHSHQRNIPDENDENIFQVGVDSWMTSKTPILRPMTLTEILSSRS